MKRDRQRETPTGDWLTRSPIRGACHWQGRRDDQVCGVFRVKRFRTCIDHGILRYRCHIVSRETDLTRNRICIGSNGLNIHTHGCKRRAT